MAFESGVLLSFGSVTQTFLAILLAYLGCGIIYSWYLHPLRHHPGPKWAAVSPIFHILWDIRGKQHSKIKELHDSYGDVVRIAPNALVFRGASAWKDIYGHRKKGQSVFLKDPALYQPVPNGTNSIITAAPDDHIRMRRLLTYAFSSKALHDQEEILHTYADILIDKLRGMLDDSGSHVVDLACWFNFTTFDLIGDLAFGEPFGCLASNQYHWWVRFICDAVKATAYLKVLWFYPLLLPLFLVLVPQSLMSKRLATFNLSVEKVRRRLKRKTSRPDFFSYILKNNPHGHGMSLDELDANAAVFVLAGSETTAALLSGCVYYLLRSPDKYNRLIKEIRGTLSRASDLKLEALIKLPYLNAVLTEALRIYPPVPAMLPRIVPEGGAFIDGHFVPAGTSVSIALYSAFHASAHFKNADEFIPERWLPSAESDEYSSDQKETFYPFSYGPRNCIGQHLANAEMRLILAKLLWHFDLDLQPESFHWSNQASFALWRRPELMIKFARAGRRM